MKYYKKGVNWNAFNNLFRVSVMQNAFILIICHELQVLTACYYRHEVREWMSNYIVYKTMMWLLIYVIILVNIAQVISCNRVVW